MPRGTSGLMINLAEDETRLYTGAGDDVVQRMRGAVLVGAYARYFVIRYSRATRQCRRGFPPRRHVAFLRSRGR